MTQEVGDLGTHELLTGPPVMTPHPFMKLCRLWTRYATKCSGSDHHTHRLRLPAAHYSTAQALTMATLMPLVKWLAPPGTRPCKMASSLPLSVVGDDSILTLGVPGREQNSHNIHMSTCTHAHVQNLWGEGWSCMRGCTGDRQHPPLATSRQDAHSALWVVPQLAPAHEID